MHAIAINLSPEIAVLLLASGLDYLIGDPWGWPHPVRVMGWLISRFTQFALQEGESDRKGEICDR
ncbi:MAG: cobalamin biosynthesis protein, partial [Coleofasciculus sp. S288]|nr:cobalamin biosynthesis protein [Coleofasciculus sp. S288]